MRDTGSKPGRLRATCAFLAGAAANIVATVCMVAYSEACRRRESERESIRDAVIAALRLREIVDGEGRYWQTPWERIEIKL